MRNTTREQFIEEEVKPVAKKRLERSLLIDEIIRKEKLQVNNEELSQEFNDTLTDLAMQGVDLSKLGGGKKKQREVSQMLAMESAGRVMTRKALNMLKAIATGEYQPVAEQPAEATTVETQAEVGADQAEQPNTEA
jgi:FKBP-type peptidyl-prolyl cis-trans isomerase (trigger factor)